MSTGVHLLRYCCRLYGDIQAILANLLLTDKADNNEEESDVEGIECRKRER